MKNTRHAIIELYPGWFLTSEHSGDAWGRSDKIEHAHIMSLEFAEKEAELRRMAYSWYAKCRVIRLFADLCELEEE